MTGKKKQQLLEENTQQESLEDVFPSALFCRMYILSCPNEATWVNACLNWYLWCQNLFFSSSSSGKLPVQICLIFS